MRNLPNQYLQGSKKSQFILGLILFICLVCVGLVLWWFYKNTTPTKNIVDADPIVTEIKQNEETKNTTEAVEEPKAVFDSVALQGTVDSWVSSLGAGDQASVVIMDVDGETLAKSNADEVYFTASIYKIYVAYVGYQKIADGTYSADEPYLEGYTRIECLDAMIRSSYSPCAEKMWIELGKDAINSKIKDYGVINTSMSGLSTTANDSANLLKNLYAGVDLIAEHRLAYLDSMKTQEAKYRRGLPSGFSSATTVYNKVGWNESIEWHDTSIVQFSDGRVLIVAVLTKNVGSSKIAELGTAIESSVAN